MDGFWYLATVYSRNAQGALNDEAGLDAAAKLACEQTALLIQAGVNVFSPIAHSHWVAKFSGLNPLDSMLWQAVDAPFVEAARGMILVSSPGVSHSAGIDHEAAMFRAARKPVVLMYPGKVPPEVLDAPVVHHLKFASPQEVGASPAQFICTCGKWQDHGPLEAVAERHRQHAGRFAPERSFERAVIERLTQIEQRIIDMSGTTSTLSSALAALQADFTAQGVEVTALVTYVTNLQAEYAAAIAAAAAGGATPAQLAELTALDAQVHQQTASFAALVSSGTASVAGGGVTNGGTATPAP